MCFDFNARVVPRCGLMILGSYRVRIGDSGAGRRRPPSAFHVAFVCWGCDLLSLSRRSTEKESDEDFTF